MFRILISTILILIVSWAQSQEYINATKTSSKKQFSKYAKANKLQTVTKETDSTLILLVRDTSVQRLDIFLHFNNRGKCDNETTTLSCDSCYDKFIAKVLQNRNNTWIEVGADLYFSKHNQLILTTRANNTFSYSVTRSNPERREYREILKKQHE